MASTSRAPARTWREFARHKSGIAGLVVLSFFALMAIFAPLIVDPNGFSVVDATGGVLQPPSSQYPLGTDEYGRSVLTLLVLGSRVSLFVGLLATVISMVLGTLSASRPASTPGGSAPSSSA